jgi:phenylacetic acid degradation operon negative regulatory protein
MHKILGNYLESQSLFDSKLSVWSLVVTIFGDAIVPRGGVLRLGALQQITDHIGISNNALRTAMSRLASDGWLERQRMGRASFYNPSAMAAHENKEASDIIYRFFPVDWNGNWLIAVSTDSDGFCPATKAKLHVADFAFQNRKLAIAPDYRMAGEGNLKFDTAGLSVFEARSFGNDNTKELLGSFQFHHDCFALYRQFTDSAEKLSNELKKCNEISGLDALLLRLLLLHQWRRIALKDVQWPRELRPPDWPGYSAQTLIRDLYHKLLAPSEVWLSQLDATPHGVLPSAENSLITRFKQ